MTAKRSATAVLVALLGACAAQDGDAATTAGTEGPSLPQASPTGPTTAAAPTSRAALEAELDALLAALQKGGAEALLAPGAHVSEDGSDVALTDSKLAGARAYTYRAFLAEHEAGQAALLGVADVGALPVAFAVRVKAAGDGALSEVEIVTVRAGEFVIAAPSALVTPDPAFESIVPEAQRQTRAELIAVADAYFTGIEAASGENVPFHSDCVRVENGVQTTRNPLQDPLLGLDCEVSLGTLGYIERVRDRRYPLVDVERGLVFALPLFDVPGGPYTAVLPDGRMRQLENPAHTWHVAEVFKIVDGKILRVEAVLRYAPLGTSSVWSVDASEAPVPPVI